VDASRLFPRRGIVNGRPRFDDSVIGLTDAPRDRTIFYLWGGSSPREEDACSGPT